MFILFAPQELHNVLGQDLPMCLLQEVPGPLHHNPLVVGDQVQEQRLRAPGDRVTGHHHIMTSHPQDHDFSHLSPNMTRAGFRQVLRQFLAASMCAVTGSSFHIGTSSGHLQQRRRIRSS